MSALGRWGWITLLGLAGVVVLAAEGLSACGHEALRLGIYAGGAAGLVLAASALPFAGKLAELSAQPESSFWKWWGAGLLTRLILLLIFAAGLAWIFGSGAAPALLTMAVIYLAGFLSETAWLGRACFFRADQALRPADSFNGPKH